MRRATATSTTIFPTGSAAEKRNSWRSLRALFFPAASEGFVQPAVTAAQGVHAIIDGLIKNWMLDDTAYNPSAVGQRVMNVYLVGPEFKPEKK